MGLLGGDGWRNRVVLAVAAAAGGCSGVESGPAQARIDELADETFTGYGVLYDPKKDPDATLGSGEAPVALYAEVESDRRDVIFELSLPDGAREPVARYWERKGREWTEGRVFGGRLELRSDGVLQLHLRVNQEDDPRTLRGSVTFVSDEQAQGCGGSLATEPRVWQWPTSDPTPRTERRPRTGPPPAPEPRPRGGSSVTPVLVIEADREPASGCGSDDSEWEGSGCGGDSSDWEGSGCAGDDGGSSGCSGDSGPGSGAGCDGDPGGVDGCSDSGCDGDLAVIAPWAAFQRFWARFGPCVLAAAVNRLWRRGRRRSCR